MLVGFNIAFIWNVTSTKHRRHKVETQLKKAFNFPLLFPSAIKFVVNFCQRLTLLSPPCSLPCYSLSACQNNEGKRNAAFGARVGTAGSVLHEYSVLHMVRCIRICIHLKALIRMLDLNTSGCGCCQKASSA